MKKSRVSFLLSIGVVVIIATAHGQESAPVNKAQAKADGIELLKKYREISSLSAPERRAVFTNASATDKSSLWRVHLAVYLVKRPELNDVQRRIVLEAISLASPEFFGAMGTPAGKAKGEELQALSQRALSVFPKNEAAEVFANLGGGKTEDDILEKYSDFSGLTIKQRKAVFRNATAQDKADLWRTHLALALVWHPELNELQKDIILYSMSLATPQFFQARTASLASKKQVEQTLRSVQERVVVAFTSEETAKIFATLGADATPASGSSDQRSSVVPRRANYSQTTNSYLLRTPSRFAGQIDLEGAPCECRSGDDWCPSHCVTGGCKVTDSGCGMFWWYACNGTCQ